MKKKFLLGAGSMFFAFALLTGCAMNDNDDDQIDDTPIDQHENDGDIMDGDTNDTIGGTNGSR